MKRYFTLLHEYPALALQWLYTSFNLAYHIVKKKYNFCNKKKQQEQSNTFNLVFAIHFFTDSKSIHKLQESMFVCWSWHNRHCKPDVTSQLVTVVYLLIVYAKLSRQWDKGNWSGYTQLCSLLIHQTTLIEMVILPRRKTRVLLNYNVFELVCLYLSWSNTS